MRITNAGEEHVQLSPALKLDSWHIQRLRDRAKATGRSQAAVVRDLIDRHLGRKNPSLHDRSKDLCGSIAGAKDLSTRKLKGFREDQP